MTNIMHIGITELVSVLPLEGTGEFLIAYEEVDGQREIYAIEGQNKPAVEFASEVRKRFPGYLVEIDLSLLSVVRNTPIMRATKILVEALAEQYVLSADEQLMIQKAAEVIVRGAKGEIADLARDVVLRSLEERAS